jgi:hypothetical protein
MPDDFGLIRLKTGYQVSLDDGDGDLAGHQVLGSHIEHR